TGTDLVLTCTEMLRKKGFVGQFVEFYGSGLSSLSVPDRATIANMAPEYGATMGFFPVDAETLAYLRFTARPTEQIALVEAYSKEQGLFRTDATPDPAFSDTLDLDLSSVEPTVAGPKPPQDRVPLRQAKASFQKAIEGAPNKHVDVRNNGDHFDLSTGSVVIAAITSCTTTSNPSLTLGAALLATTASLPAPSSAAIATSKAASTRSSARIIWPRRRSSSPTPSPAAWTSISPRSPSALTPRANPFIFGTSGQAPKRSRRPSAPPSPP